MLDAHTIGWLERPGNRQYVGTGNIAAELVTPLGGGDVRHDGAITVAVAVGPTDPDTPSWQSAAVSRGRRAGLRAGGAPLSPDRG